MHHNVVQMIATDIISATVKLKLIESYLRYKLQSKKEASMVVDCTAEHFMEHHEYYSYGVGNNGKGF